MGWSVLGHGCIEFYKGSTMTKGTMEHIKKVLNGPNIQAFKINFSPNDVYFEIDGNKTLEPAYEQLKRLKKYLNGLGKKVIISVDAYVETDGLYLDD
jgi:hypothetical protein